jgi:hypothetical protein
MPISRLLVSLLAGLLIAFLSSDGFDQYVDASPSLIWSGIILILVFAYTFSLFKGVEGHDKFKVLYFSLLVTAILAVKRYFAIDFGIYDYTSLTLNLLFIHIASCHLCLWLSKAGKADINDRYKALFSFAWNNIFIPIVGLLFVLVVGALIGLAVYIDEFLVLGFVDDIITYRYLIFPLFTIIFAYGVYQAQLNIRSIHYLRDMVLSLCKFILPVMVVMALIVEFAIPIRELFSDSVDHRSSLLSLLLALMIFTINGVFQGGERQDPPFKTVIWQKLLSTSIILLPVLAGFDLYFLWLRVAQYGLDFDDFIGLLFSLVLATYSLCYSIACFTSHNWLSAIRKCNIYISYLILLLLLLIKTPILDPVKIVLESQYQRILASDDANRVVVRKHLFSDSGELGQEYLRKIQQLSQQNPKRYGYLPVDAEKSTCKVTMSPVIAYDSGGDVLSQSAIPQEFTQLCKARFDKLGCRTREKHICRLILFSENKAFFGTGVISYKSFLATGVIYLTDPSFYEIDQATGKWLKKYYGRSREAYLYRAENQDDFPDVLFYEANNDEVGIKIFN